MQIIKYLDTDITNLFLASRWAHPDTGVKYPANFDLNSIEGVTVEIVPDSEPIALETQPRTWTPLAFLELFSIDKQLAVKQASMANAQIGLWYDKLLASSEVVENDPRLTEGLAFLVQAGILTQSDVDTALLD